MALASLSLDDPGPNQASLASMPEELWRRIAAYLRPATTARAFVVASGRSSSLQKALRAEIEQTERNLFGITRGEAEKMLVEKCLMRGAGKSRTEASESLNYLLETSKVMADNPASWLTDDVARWYLAYGADPNALLFGVPLLVRVAQLVASSETSSDPMALAKLLIAAGADPNATDGNGLSALATCYQNLMVWFEQRDWETAVRSSKLTGELIGFLIATTYDQMHVPGTRGQGFDVLHPQIRKQEEALPGLTYLDVTSRYLRFFDETAGDIPGGNRFVAEIVTIHHATTLFSKQSAPVPVVVDAPTQRQANRRSILREYM